MKMKPPVRSPPKPVALTVSVKTYENDWWLSGTKASTSTMNATPAMCQYAEIVFRSAVNWTFSRLITSADGEEDDVQEEDVFLRVRIVEPEVEERGPEGREAVADRRGDRDLPDEVEPPREPPPRGRAELRGPVVEPARRGEGRRDLCHRERDDRAHQADEQPAPRHGDRATLAERDVVRGEAPREDRDDREADREVLEAAHPPEQLLRVAEPVEDVFVLRGVMPAACGGTAHVTALLSLAEGVHSPTARVACQDMPPIVRVSHDVADGLGSRDADA